MKTACSPLWLLLCTLCIASRAVAADGTSPRETTETLGVEVLSEGQLRLSFPSVAPDPALERLEVEEARTARLALHESFLPRKETRLQFAPSSIWPLSSGDTPAPEWQSRLRQQFLSRFGAPEPSLPDSLETSPLFLALKQSPRYMGAGVRDAATELFSSPLFLSSVAFSVLVYFSAWLVSEPFFSKAFVATLTLRLSLAVGALELTQVARACVRLYQEAQAARTPREVEAVAERFGKALGGTGLRVLVLVASMGVARVLPQVPGDGLGSLLSPPRFALPRGMKLESATTVQMVADGTVLVTGVAAGTAATTVGSACSDGSEVKAGHHWHHLATNKNDISTLYGGPWTPRFEELFELAGMNLDAKENLVYLKGHKGPHPEEYHREVHKRLASALAQCRSRETCRRILMEMLKKIADEVCTPGSQLHKLLTKT